MGTAFRFPSIFFGISVNALALLLLTSLSNTTGEFSFYDKPDSEGFLKRCVSCKSCDSCPDDDDVSCKELLREDPTVDYDENSNRCSEKSIQELKIAQETVKKFQNKLDSYAQSIILWALFIPSICIGIYLIAVGHFDWRTLPIIGSKYHPNPTTGIPYWQYYRMKYVVFKSEASKHGGVQGKNSNNSFVEDAYSSVGSASSDSEGDSQGESADFKIPQQSRADMLSNTSDSSKIVI